MLLRIALRVAGLLLGLAGYATPAAAQQAAAHPSYALVIGNAAYKALPALSACEASANTAAAALGRAGFSVTEVLNPSNAQMGEALATLGDTAAASAGGRAVVYVCGYITSFSDRLFVLPVDAHLERPADVLTQGIVARLLMASALSATSGAGLVLMDAATAPGQPALTSFASMLRPDDAAHGGLAASELPANAAIGRVAAALPAVSRPLPLDVGHVLRTLAARPEFAHPGDLAVQQPASPSILLDAADLAGEARPPAAPDTPSRARATRTPKDRR